MLSPVGLSFNNVVVMLVFEMMCEAVSPYVGCISVAENPCYLSSVLYGNSPSREGVV